MTDKTENVLDLVKAELKFCRLLGIDALMKAPDSPGLEERILSCRSCVLSRTRTQAVPGEGNPTTDLMFVGEAPGRDEDLQGRPFVGRAGQLLTKIIEAMTFNREEVYITNIVKCRPPENRDPEPEEIESCRGYLLEQIASIEPKVIVTLGRISSRFFTGSRLAMTKLRGEFYDFQGIKVMPTFHPSYLIRNQGNRIIRGMVWEDMQKVMAVLGRRK